MVLRIVAHDANFNQPANSHWVYPLKIAHDKMSAMRNVNILCSNCPPAASAQARSLFRHSPTTTDDVLIQLILLIHNAFS